MQDRPGRLRAIVVPHIALTKARAPHAVKNIRVAGLGKNEHRIVGLDGRDQVFILAGNVEDFDFFQVNLRIIRKILQPGQNLCIVKQLLFHRAVTPFCPLGTVCGMARRPLDYYITAAVNFEAAGTASGKNKKHSQREPAMLFSALFCPGIQDALLPCRRTALSWKRKKFGWWRDWVYSNITPSPL